MAEFAIFRTTPRGVDYLDTRDFSSIENAEEFALNHYDLGPNEEFSIELEDDIEDDANA